MGEDKFADDQEATCSVTASNEILGLNLPHELQR